MLGVAISSILAHARHFKVSGEMFKTKDLFEVLDNERRLNIIGCIGHNNKKLTKDKTFHSYKSSGVSLFIMLRCF